MNKGAAAIVFSILVPLIACFVVTWHHQPVCICICAVSHSILGTEAQGGGAFSIGKVVAVRYTPLASASMVLAAWFYKAWI